MRVALGFVCGVAAVPVLAMLALHSEKIEDLAMRFLNSDFIERMWG